MRHNHKTETESITFKSNDGRELLFGGIHYDITIEGLMATTTITQLYANPYKSNIEAIYTFPMDPDALLLDIEVIINERRLKGRIVEKREAEATYEEAIDEGNRAIMVEKLSAGLYTISIANILPDDTVAVVISYTQLLEWRGDRVRYSIPTTIAQKYGDPTALGLDDINNPVISLFAENRFALSMRVEGILTQGSIKAPSQEIAITREKTHTLVTLTHQSALMDKDIRFLFKVEKDAGERSFVLLAKDPVDEGYATIASFYPDFGIDTPRKPKSVTFVIDCSGSMSGISIDRARTALHKAVNLLGEEDHFNIIAFGSHYSELFDYEVPATQENLTIAKKMIRHLDANMGGTEMEVALNFAYESHTQNRDKKREGYLFLITDGEVYNHNDIFSGAKKSEMIHFVVGVGYAADSALLSKLADKTGGSYEGMDPNEKMDDAILALFKKIDYPKAREIRVEWPGKPLLEHAPDILFDGDTLYATALFQTKPTGEARLRYRLDDDTQREDRITLGEAIPEAKRARAITALVVAAEIDSLKEQVPRTRRAYNDTDTLREENKTIIALSTKYQLFSELTNYILVDEVADDKKPLDLPVMHRVEHMLLECDSVIKNRSYMCYSHKERSAPASFDTGLLRYLYRKITGKDKIRPLAEKHHDPIREILDAIATEDYELYLKRFETWYLKHGRLPRSKKELREMGLSDEVVALMKTAYLREQVKYLVIELRSYCRDSDLSDTFIVYLDNIDAMMEEVVTE